MVGGEVGVLEMEDNRGRKVCWKWGATGAIDGADITGRKSSKDWREGLEDRANRLVVGYE